MKYSITEEFIADRDVHQVHHSDTATLRDAKKTVTELLHAAEPAGRECQKFIIAKGDRAVIRASRDPYGKNRNGVPTIFWYL
jgi:hypothetical protein